MNFAPSATAVFTEAPRFARLLSFASTSRMLQFGQIADTMSTSSDISSPQPTSVAGSGLAWPFWFTFVKFAGGRPNVERYVARSDATFGSSNASTIATVTPAPPELLMAYALCRSAGPKPDGSALAETAAAAPPIPATSVRRSARHDAKP